MIIDLKQLANLRKVHANNKIVFAGGVFDLIHDGHIQHLQELKQLGDIVVIALSSDERVRERKGPLRPINSAEVRIQVMDAIKYVDYCLIAPTPSEISEDIPPTGKIIRILTPDFFVTSDPRYQDYEQEVSHLGTQIIYKKENKINSSSQIIEIVRQRYKGPSK